MDQKPKRSYHRLPQVDRDWSKSKFLSLNVIAEELGVSNVYVRRLVDRQEMEAHNIGGTIRISKKAYAAFLEKTKMKFVGRKLKNYEAEAPPSIH